MRLRNHSRPCIGGQALVPSFSARSGTGLVGKKSFGLVERMMPISSFVMLISSTLILSMTSAGCGEMEGYSRPQVRPEKYGIVTNPEELARPAAPAAAPPPAPSPTTPGGEPRGTSATPPGPRTPATPAAPPPSATASAESSSSEPAAPPPGYVRERAGVGATGKGNYRPGILTTPLSVYWRAQERIIFEQQIPHAMQLYHAMNGRYPGSWEEFEREILVPNGIRLPTLPPGHRYHYDPQSGQLMVEKPAP